jgi:hypothetical protein
MTVELSILLKQETRTHFRKVATYTNVTADESSIEARSLSKSFGIEDHTRPSPKRRDLIDRFRNPRIFERYPHSLMDPLAFVDVRLRRTL